MLQQLLHYNRKRKKKYGAHSHVRATARLVNAQYSQQRSAVRSTAPNNNNHINNRVCLDEREWLLNARKAVSYNSNKDRMKAT